MEMEEYFKSPFWAEVFSVREYDFIEPPGELNSNDVVIGQMEPLEKMIFTVMDRNLSDLIDLILDEAVIDIAPEEVEEEIIGNVGNKDWFFNQFIANVIGVKLNKETIELIDKYFSFFSVADLNLAFLASQRLGVNPNHVVFLQGYQIVMSLEEDLQEEVFMFLN